MSTPEADYWYEDDDDSGFWDAETPEPTFPEARNAFAAWLRKVSYRGVHRSWRT